MFPVLTLTAAPSWKSVRKNRKIRNSSHKTTRFRERTKLTKQAERFITLRKRGCFLGSIAVTVFQGAASQGPPRRIRADCSAARKENHAARKNVREPRLKATSLAAAALPQPPRESKRAHGGGSNKSLLRERGGAGGSVRSLCLVYNAGFFLGCD